MRVLIPSIALLASAASAHTSVSAADSTASTLSSTTGSTASTTTGSTVSTGDGVLKGLTATPTGNAYQMSPVRVIQARVQSDMPAWNEEGQRFVSKFGKDLASGYLSAMDTVNTASVEGALMYVQAEGINYNTRSEEQKCTRKNNMQYVVFYDIVFAQTNETLAQFEDTTDQNEYGPMVPMDSGSCTPLSSTGGQTKYPTECYMFNGDNGKANVGPFVGGENKTTDARAPYPNTIWYSFPNTCPLQAWSNKTTTCRADTRKGLCDMGVMPDGVTCTFSYKILGFLPIDDLVGITAMTSNSTGKTYTNFTEFCQDGGIEFQATEDGVWNQSIPFWEKPQDADANSERAQKLIEAYQNLTSGGLSSPQVSSDIVAHMSPLPTIESLAAANPPCYKNVKKCNTEFGCKRELYGQLCIVCTSKEDGCVAPSGDFTFPTLVKAVGSAGSDESSGSVDTGSDVDEDTASSNAATTKPKTASAASASAMMSVVAVVASVLVASMLL